jgi:hypothetical protein
VDYSTSFETGIKAGPRLAIEKWGFEAQWLAAREALAIIQPVHHESLRAGPARCSRSTKDPRRVLVRKP